MTLKTNPSTSVESSRDSLLGRARVFVRILNVRLRFIFLMLLVGLVAGNWDRITNYYDRWRRPTHLPEMVEAQDIEYYCPMHPNIVRAEPGNCPICGMPLSKRARTGRAKLAEGVLAVVQMSPQKVQMGAIATTPVEYKMLSREIRTVGVVDYDETGRAFVAARVKGRLDKLYVNYVGQHVDKGEPLAAIYSPDLVVAQEDLLSAVRRSKEPQGRGETTGFNQSLVESSRKKLVRWGLTEQQIDEIITRGKAETDVTILSPIAGIVTEKKVLEGHYVAEGDDLYTIADLSHVWAQLKIFEDEFVGVQVGTAVEVSSVAFPNEIFPGRIAFIGYTVDPATRTVAARVEIDNEGLKLKPGMYIRAVIRLPAGRVTELSTTMPVTNSAPADGPRTDDLAKAYLTLLANHVADKAGGDELGNLARQARLIAPEADDAARRALDEIAAQVDAMGSQDLKSQRVTLQTLSQRVIAFLREHPPAVSKLFVAHCPMVNADWLQSSETIANPYYGSQMLRCGAISGRIAAEAAPKGERYAEGFFCPIYPDRLFDEPAQCPIDKFPMKRVRLERTLAVPESAVINTGSRTVVYRESGPGTFEMIEVKLGPRAGDSYPVLEGVKPADRVVTAGAFVVDAENRLNPSAGAQYSGPGGATDSASGQHTHGQ